MDRTDTFTKLTLELKCSMKIVSIFQKAWRFGSQVRQQLKHTFERDFQLFHPSGPSSEQIDLVVTLGGDGTILHASSLFSVGAVPPVLSFSMGTLGFLLPFRESHSLACLCVYCCLTGNYKRH